MRRFLIGLVPLVAAGPALAADCSADVTAAFAKQRDAKMYRIEMSQPTAEGPVTMTVDYILPDRMQQTVVAPHMPGEQQTVLVGDRAFAGASGAFEELLPQFSHSIIAEFRNSTTGNNENLGKFECLGKIEFEGKEFIGFRTAEEMKDGQKPEDTLARTIYVDETTGRPAFNIVKALAGTAEPAMKAVYSYPTDIEIEAPLNAPVQQRRQ